MSDRFGGITLTKTTVSYGKQHGPIQGASARIEAGNTSNRVTAGRLLTRGVFAFTGNKPSVYLTVDGTGYSFVVEVPAKKETEARKFAAKVNTAAKG